MAKSSFFNGTGVSSNYVTDLEVITEEAKAHRDAAEVSANAAEADAQQIAADANVASTNAASAQASATLAANSVADVADSATQAANSQSAAATSATQASTSASTASTSASQAAGSEGNAATSETNASTSATNAATSETNASTSATNAATSATNAQTAQTAAELAETNAETAESNAAASATNAATSEANASTSASTASTKASEAATSETNAATSETNAATSETNASTSATNAATSETNAATSAAAASASQTAAAASAASAASAYDSFDDRYLGPKSADPSVDNDGNALVSGALYFNSTADEMRVYDGANWIAASSAGSASLINYNYTATSGQTTFSGADDNAVTLSYTQQNLIVTLNGIVLEDGTDYTANNGTSVVLTTGASAGDELNVVAFKSFTTADMVPASTGGTFFGNVTVSGAFTSQGIDDNATSTAMTLASSGRVGIGTASPARALDVQAASGDADVRIYAQGTTSSDDAILYLGIAGTTATNRINFGDVNDADRGRIIYGHSSDYMSFTTAASEAARIDGSGNLLVGKTVADNTTQGARIYSTGRMSLVSQDDDCLILNRRASDGVISTFRKNGTTVGVIGVKDADPYIGKDAVGLTFDATGADGIRPFNTATQGVRDDGIDLGGSASRFQDLYLSGGVYLGGTGSANKLDDYEEGTWTPYANGGFSGFTVQDAIYVKIGKQCTVFMWVSSTTGADANAVRIGGLPFNTASGVYGHIGSCVAYGSSNNSKATTCYAGQNSSEVILVNAATTGMLPVSGISGSSFGTNTSIQLTLTYYTG